MKYLAAALLTFALNAVAAETKPTGTLIDFQAQAQRSAPNDLGYAAMYFEATGAHAGELSKRVNQAISAALATAKSHPEIKVKSGSTQTYPVYAKGNRTIESWRMRSEVLLESRDAAALSDLVGKLQATLAVGSMRFTPAPETLRKADDEAAMDALAAFQEKATRYAAALKKQYRIVSITIGSNGVPPAPSERYAMMKAVADSMPVEAGESQIVVGVTGQIELLESAASSARP